MLSWNGLSKTQLWIDFYYANPPFVSQSVVIMNRSFHAKLARDNYVLMLHAVFFFLNFPMGYALP